MCLGVPGRIIEVEEGALRMGQVAFCAITKTVCLSFVPEAGPGDYVIVHVGFAISRLDEAEASRVFDYLDKLGELS